MSEQKPPSNEPFDLSALYKQGAAELPPESLDRDILAKAEDELQPAQGNRWKAWQWPLSAAAVVVVASSIILDLRQQDQLGVEPMILEEMMPMDSEMMEATPSLRMPAPAQQDTQTSEITDEVLKDKVHTEEKVAPARVIKSEQIMPAQAPASSSAMNEPNVGTAERFELKLKESQVKENQVKESKNRQSMKAMEFKQRELMRKKSMERQDVDQSVAVDGDDRTSDVWLNDIQTLLDENQKEQALEELRAFRLAYPDIQLSQELERLLNED